VLGPDDVELRRQVGVLAAGAHDPVVLREQVLGFAGELDTRGTQDNRVVADAFRSETRCEERMTLVSFSATDSIR
jgi:hypothetical protein